MLSGKKHFSQTVKNIQLEKTFYPACMLLIQLNVMDIWNKILLQKFYRNAIVSLQRHAGVYTIKKN